MCKIPNLSNLHFRGRLSLHNMFGIFLRIYWCRNFCDMAEISTIPKYFAKSYMVGNHTPDSNKAKKSGYMRYIRHFSTIHGILVEISAISQKFLHQYIRKKIPNILSNNHFPVVPSFLSYKRKSRPPVGPFTGGGGFWYILGPNHIYGQNRLKVFSQILVGYVDVRAQYGTSGARSREPSEMSNDKNLGNFTIFGQNFSFWTFRNWYK